MTAAIFFWGRVPIGCGRLGPSPFFVFIVVWRVGWCVLPWFVCGVDAGSAAAQSLDPLLWIFTARILTSNGDSGCYRTRKEEL